MSFGAAEWLWGLLLLPVWGALMLWLDRRRAQRLALFAGNAIVDRVRLAHWPWIPSLRTVLIVAALGCVLLALARPRWGHAEELVRQHGLDLVIALDVSNSMLAEDLAPSRLAVARQAARELVRALPMDRVGLVAFAGTAARICPLTHDRAAFEMYLEAVDPSLFSMQGTDLGAALRVASEMFPAASTTRRVLVVLSDGEDHEAGLAASRELLKQALVATYAVGFGTLEGSPLPMRGVDGKLSGYRTDEQGRTVTSQLQEQALQLLSANSGAYLRVSSAANAARDVAAQLRRLERGDQVGSVQRRQAERYRWPLAIALLLMILEAALIMPRREAA